MHCEKNICESMLKVIFGEKDFVVVEKDMEEMGILRQLWLWQLANGSYMKSNEKKKVFFANHKEVENPIKLCFNPME